GVALILVAFAKGLAAGRHGNHSTRVAMVAVFSGLWFSSALFAYLAVKAVHGIDRLWRWARTSISEQNQTTADVIEPQNSPGQSTPASAVLAPPSAGTFERLADPSRRYFFRTATALAGATPFLGAVYGFAAERINYQVRRVEIPIT